MSSKQQGNPLDSNYENIVGKLSACQKVIEMMETEGWKEIVGPRMHNMINEFSGTTDISGRRTKGKVAESADPYQLATNIGIKLGMENIYNMIVSHLNNYDFLRLHFI